MLEVPCTLRCDECKETKSVVLRATARYVDHTFPARMRTEATFDISEEALPEGWTFVPGPTDKLRCPRCNGAK